MYVSCWYEKVNKNGSKGWRIVNQFVRREETHHRHLSCATIQSRLSLYVPREPCECSLHLELILHSCLLWKRVLQCSIELQESWEHGLPNDPKARKVPSSSSISWRVWRNTHRRAMGRGRGRRGAARSRRLRTQTHGGESDVQLPPEAPGKHSGSISGTSECFILIHAVLRSPGQLWVWDKWCIFNMFWFYSIL